MQNYSYTQQFLHNIYLGNKFIKKSLFEIEKLLFLKKKELQINSGKHVFITGLPRSGTTILLNFIYKSNQFASLTYENAPFVMATNFFTKISKDSNFEESERFHQDGIFVNLKSPEALDEPFFSTFTDDEIRNQLISFITLILSNKKKNRYLSKNNLHYKRIDLIQEIIMDAIILIPFRDPLQQACSLFEQHNHFIKLQNKNDFIRKYMNYFGHNEFGKNHISWNIPIKYHNFTNINYWLEQWLLFYQNIYKKNKKNKKCYFVCYEDLINKNYTTQLLKKIHVEEIINFSFRNKIRKINYKFDENLYEKAVLLYQEIKSMQ